MKVGGTKNRRAPIKKMGLKFAEFVDFGESGGVGAWLLAHDQAGVGRDDDGRQGAGDDDGQYGRKELLHGLLSGRLGEQKRTEIRFRDMVFSRSLSGQVLASIITRQPRSPSFDSL